MISDETLDLIDLKWTLRDIASKRDNLVTAKSHHNTELMNRGLVEILDNKPVITEAGLGLIRQPERR